MTDRRGGMHVGMHEIMNNIRTLRSFWHVFLISEAALLQPVKRFYRLTHVLTYGRTHLTGH